MRPTITRPTMPSPEIGGKDGIAGLQVYSQPVEGTAAAEGNSQAQALAEALRTINPRIDKYLAEQTAANTQDAKVAGQAAAATAYSNDPNAALTSPESASVFAPPAYARAFSEGYRETVATSMAAKSSSALLDGYETHKNEEGFDGEAYVQKFVKSELNGLNDPLILATVNKHLAPAVSEVRTKWDALLHQRVRDTNEANLQNSLTANVSIDKSPEDMAKAYQSTIVPSSVATGQFTRPELAQRFASHINFLSQSNGGRPELFDALFIPDENGMAPALANGQMKEQIEKWKLAAIKQRDAHLSQKNLMANTVTYNGMKDAIKNGDWDAVSDEKLYEHVSEGGVFPTFHAMEAMRQERDTARFGSEQLKVGIEAYPAGKAWMLDPKVAKDAYDNLAQAPLSNLLGNLGQTGPDADKAVSDSVTQLLGISQRGNLGHISDALKRRIDAAAVSVPKDGAAPPADFVQLANIRAAMKAQNQTLADKYFDGDARDLFDKYNESTSVGQENAQSAYQSAYHGISPEARKQWEQVRKADPQFDQKITDKVKGVTQSFNMFRAQWMGTYPTNDSAISSWALLRAKEVFLKNPDAGMDSVAAQVQNEAKGIFVREPQSNTVVRVPAGMANDNTTEALTRWVKAKEASWGSSAKTMGLSFGFDPTGKMTWHTINPRDTGTADIADIMRTHAEASTLQPADLAALSAIRQKAAAGTVTAADYSQPLIDKMKATGLWKSDDQVRYQNAADAARAGTQANEAGLISSRFARLPAQPISNDYAGTSKVDTLTTKPTLDDKGAVARMFLQQGNLAGALTSMGEGVALTAYGDPAAGAGQNIGIGYNKQGNAKTWEADFKAAGIPPEQNDAVWAGQRSITREQAMRLYQTVQKRYEDRAKTAYEKQGAAGDWDKLPANQRAVLTDLAYQVRDPNAFPKAYEAFRNGDVLKAGKEILTSYNAKDGQMRADVGRHSLRTNMLASPTQFETLLNYAGAKPDNKVVASQ